MDINIFRVKLKGCPMDKKFDKSMSLGSQIVFSCYNELVAYFRQKHIKNKINRT
jgi:hypothetical protein